MRGSFYWTLTLGRVICGNVFLLAPGPSVLARQTVTATRQLVCLVATTVGRHRCWGAHFISFGFDTHHPDLLPQVMGRCWGAHFITGSFDIHHPDPLLEVMGSTP